VAAAAGHNCTAKLLCLKFLPLLQAASSAAAIKNTVILQLSQPAGIIVRAAGELLVK